MRKKIYKRLINNDISGFSLLELAIVVTIIALIAASSMLFGKSMLDSAEVSSTNNRLSTIETALLAYRQANNRLPCPADPQLLTSSVSYGAEGGNPGACVSAHPVIVTVGGSNIAEGAVPVRALNLPDEFMYDGWNRKIGYAVWVPGTANNSFTDYGIALNCGNITVKNAGGAPRSTRADYVLISYGTDGHGSYDTTGARVNASSVNPSEDFNAHFSSLGVDTGYLGAYIMMDPTQDSANVYDNFSNIVRYKERWQLQTINDQNNPGGNAICPGVLPGVRFDGGPTAEKVGYSVAVGDVNGDGIPDLIIGAQGRSSVYVVFGNKNGFADPISLPALNGTNGFRLDGVGDFTGTSVAVGDVNGDGIADIIIGAVSANAGAGAVYVVYGKTTGWGATMALSTLNGANGFRLDGVNAGGSVGSSVSAGDMNGDGIADIAMGAPGGANGRAYVMFGSKTLPVVATHTLDNVVGTNGVIDGTQGFEARSTTADSAGVSVALSDINGDGIADLIIGAPAAGGSNNGAAYIVFGKTKGWVTPFSLGELNGNNGTIINGVSGGDFFGKSLATGDVNGDGYYDLMVGASGYNGGAFTGATYVIFGHTTAWPQYFNLANINGINGSRIVGVTAGDSSGLSVAAGDVSGDGIADIIIGAPTASPGGNAGAGSTYVLFGSNAAWAPSIALSTLNGSNGFRLDGSVAGHSSGWSVSAGDVNGDGKYDVITGAIGTSYGGGANSGSAYVYYGQKKTAPWTNPYNLGGL